MAIYKLFPEKDATLYTQYPTMNTGLDEILEASTYLFDAKAQTSRYLIKFSQNEINSVYTSYISGSGISFLSTETDSLLGSLAAGQNPTGLTNDTYLEVPLTSSTGVGIGATANIVVTGNTISSITVVNRGKNYKLGNILKANYTFSDLDGDREESSAFQWYRNGNPILNENSLNYKINKEDIGAKISLGIIMVVPAQII